MSETTKREPNLLEALLPVFFLILLLFGSVRLFGDSSSSGPNQIALILSGCVAGLIGLRNGYTWREIEEAMVHGISLSMGALFILLVVGSLIGTWIMAGIVPTMIYYGLQILHPAIFYFAACIICAVIAVSTGSSWTTAGTVGLALIGIGEALGLSTSISAGAVISGAYFGDKLSPLSDTTNLAPAMAGTDLFTHIRHMLWTTLPSLTIALILFLIIGLMANVSGQADDLQPMLKTLDSSFNIGWYMLIPPVLVLVMVKQKVPAFPALLIGALIGGVFAMIFQQDALVKSLILFNESIGYESTVQVNSPDIWALLKGVWVGMYNGYISSTGNANLDDLLSGGGMASMLSTVWLIISAMMFGSAMEKTRKLEVIAASILSMVKNTGSLVLATLGTCFGMNVVASDQYIAIVIPGRMFRAEFERRGLHPKNLSRCLEDSGTLTSVLVPWNTCGAYFASTLGVATFAYLPFCFFNILNPIISAIYGFTGISMEKLEPEDGDAVGGQPA